MTDEGTALKRWQEETEPGRHALGRVRSRIEATLQEAAPTSAVRPLLAGLAGGALAAAIALAVVVGRDPATVPLVADTPAELRPVRGLDLLFEGRGALGGTDAAPEIAWEGGRVAIEVDPAAGLDVAVTTGEGTARVVGTAFTVERDAAGTRVAVARGVVDVACRRGEVFRLEADAAAECLPTTAAGMLARARALQDGGAPAEAVLGAVEDGLGRPGLTDPVGVELRIVRVEALRDARRTAEALVEARALLPVAGHRRAEVSELVADLARRR